jgi:spectinomycin phosphotransferase
MTRDDPGLDARMMRPCLEFNYGIRVTSLRFLTIGHDFSAFVYEVISDDGTSYFLKIRSGPVNEPALQIPRELIDRGVPNILAPLRTCTSDLCCPLDEGSGSTVVLYPFIRGENAMDVGLTHDQMREFGGTLRAVHESTLAERFGDVLRIEDFALPSAALVRRMIALAHESAIENPVARRFAAFLREHTDRIHQIIARAEELGRSLQDRSFELVLCHSDIHAANILVGEDGRIWLVDWDGPLLAPRERDLLFVIGSKIARPMTPNDERLFFEGYGPTEIDPTALIYYRYERIIEDIGEFGKSVFLDTDLSDAARENEARLARSFFAPGGFLEWVEVVTPHW